MIISKFLKNGRNLQNYNYLMINFGHSICSYIKANYLCGFVLERPDS